MRVYLPLLPSELLAAAPRSRTGFTVVAPEGCDREDVEVLEDDAQTEAALRALSLVREDAAEKPLRMIVAQDVDALPPPGEGIVETGEYAITWDTVVAILADEPDAVPRVQRVLDAQDQEEADEAVAALWELCLGWYDVSERESLARLIESAVP